METKPVLSVITVVYNDEKNIEKTIQSVISQTYPQIEYIVIDGKSTDNTVYKIKRYMDYVNIFVSEPDEGLYDAMNKGLMFASGDYVCFLNSGDTFHDKTVVDRVFTKCQSADFIYGHTLIVDDDRNPKGLRRLKPITKIDFNSFSKGMLISHQACFVRKSFTEEYNLNYKYTADYDWCINILKKHPKTCNTNLILIDYLDGGYSKKTLFKSLKERFVIMKKNYGITRTIYTHLINGVKLFIFYLKNRWF